MYNLTENDIQRLKTQAEEIRFETREAFNTAERVGAMFIALIEALKLFEDLSDKFLKKHEEDTADEVITFLKGIICGAFDKEMGKGARIDGDGNAEFNRLDVRDEAIFRETLSSPDFISGFLDGKGWSLIKERVLNALGIPEYKYTLEIDNLVVRGILRVFEFVVSQLLGENDNRIFTAMLEVDHYDPETGIVWLDTQGGKFYNPFRKDDYIMVQQFNGMPSEENGYYVIKAYELIITEVGIGNLADGENRLDWVKFKNFTTQMAGITPEDIIKKGDTFVRIDNASDPDRKGLVMITTVGHKTPYMDIAYGMKTDPEGYLKGRLGNLEGIRHHLFGWLQGFGAYLINFYGVGDFRLRRTGESLDTLVEILKDRFSSIYSSFIYDVSEEDNYLFNPSFTENMEGWNPIIDDSKLISLPGDEAFLMNGNLMVADSRRAYITTYEGKKMLYIYDSGITQDNELIRKPGTHNVYDSSKGVASSWDTKMADSIDGTYKTEKDKLYLFVKFLAKTSGNLTIGFRGASSEEGSLPNPATVFIDASTEWQMMEWIGTWDGKGYFILEYTGEMYVSQLSLTSEPLDDFKTEIGTQILQTARNIQLLGYNIDAKAGKLTDLGIEINAVDASIRLWVNTEIRNEYTELIKGTEIKLTDEMASMKAYLEQTISDTAGILRKEIKEAGLEITAEVARLYATKEEFNIFGESVKSSISSLEVRADKIEGRVSEAEKGIETNRSTITQTASSIRTEVADIKNELSSSITQTASQIRSEVSDIKTGLQSQITQNANNINLKVSKGEVINQINIDNSGVKISASKIQIAGDFSVNDAFHVTTGGQITFQGILRFSTAFQGNISNYQIFYLHPDIGGAKDLTMGSETDDLGKVVWFYNASQYTHKIYGNTFPITGSGRVTETYGYAIAPEEAMQMTCFQTDDNKAEWIMTQRLSYQQFRKENYMGRYPILWAMGTMTYNRSNGQVSLSGNFYNAKSLSSVMSVARVEKGIYEITFASGTLPSNYFIMIQATQGQDSDDMSIFFHVSSKSATKIRVVGADDDSFNDGSFDFMIYDYTNWYYS